jgi:hypothetical protein
LSRPRDPASERRSRGFDKLNQRVGRPASLVEPVETPRPGVWVAPAPLVELVETPRPGLAIVWISSGAHLPRAVT